MLRPIELIGAIESALIAFSSGKVIQPVRTAVEIGDRSFFALMPALFAGQSILGAKLVTVVPGNAARGLHTHLAAISLFHPETGELLAVMDGRYITEVRTAAASAVSVRHLARKDAKILAILGTGVQARSHLDALPHVRPLEDIRVWSPTPGHAEQFSAAAAGRVRAASSPVEAVRDADIVVVATSSVTPAIQDAWVRAGTHVIAIGACRPSQREVDPALVTRARVLVDSRAAALVESGDIVQSIQEGLFGPEHVAAELGEVAAGLKRGRTSDDQVTLFKSLGLAVEDVTAAGLAYRQAVESGLGRLVEL